MVERSDTTGYLDLDCLDYAVDRVRFQQKSITAGHFVSAGCDKSPIDLFGDGFRPKTLVIGSRRSQIKHIGLTQLKVLWDKTLG